MKPIISIITPSFNQAQYIEQTIDSVLSQNYPRLEYIILDGGSTDGSVDVIKRHEKHLKYWASKPDRGQSHAINEGLAHVTGDVFNWLNSDDYYEPNALKEVGEAFNDSSTLVFSGKGNIVMDGEILRQSSGTDIYFDNLDKTIGWARIDQPETFFRRSAFIKVGPLNESLKYVMDKEWWIRYLLTFGLSGIQTTKSCLVNFRLHSSSKTVSQAKGFFDESLLVYYALAQRLDDKKIAQRMAQLFELKSSVYDYTGPHTDQRQGSSILNYFLLRLADETYHNLDFRLVKEILKIIDEHELQVTDQQLFKKLSLRSKFPPWLIQLLRK